MDHAVTDPVDFTGAFEGAAFEKKIEHLLNSALVRGLIQRIGEGTSSSSCTTEDGRSFSLNENVPDHKSAIKEVFNLLFKSGTLKSTGEIDGIGHRMVHGGEHFR
ncbi:MAG: hypothetical protein P8Z37_01480, partial [Acidobacteriota bacterium]